MTFLQIVGMAMFLIPALVLFLISIARQEGWFCALVMMAGLILLVLWFFFATRLAFGSA